VHHRSACKKPGGDEHIFLPIGLEFGAIDHLHPDPALGRLDELHGAPFELDAPACQDGHAWARSATSSTMWVERMTDHILADLGKEVQEAVALLRIEAGGGLVDDDELGIADQRLGDPEALPHSAREAGKRLLAHRPQVHLVEEGLDRPLAIGCRGDALQHRHMVEHVVADTRG
jgi:hypothetical protein